MPRLSSCKANVRGCTVQRVAILFAIATIICGVATATHRAEHRRQSVLLSEGRSTTPTVSPPQQPAGYSCGNTSVITSYSVYFNLTGAFCHPSSVQQIDADTWYPQVVDRKTGLLFSSFTDGTALGVGSFSATYQQATTGVAFMTTKGTPNTTFVHNTSVVARSALPLRGRYPTAPFVRKGVLYYGTYGLSNGIHVPQYRQEVCPLPSSYWCVSGPFIGWHYSTDMGKTWRGDEHLNVTNNVFQQQWPKPPLPFYFKVMQPHVVDFSAVPEGKVPYGDAVYMLSHGCGVVQSASSASTLNCGWAQGDSIVVLRNVAVSPENVNDATAWEVFAAGNKWETVGARGAGLATATAVINRPNRVGIVNTVWVPGVGAQSKWYANATQESAAQACFVGVGGNVGGLYLTFTSAPSEGMPPGNATRMTTLVFASPTPCGPFREVAEMKDFGPMGYFVHAPSFFLQSHSAWTVEGYLWYSAVWDATQLGKKPVNPPYCTLGVGGRKKGNCYGSVMAEFVFRVPA